MLQEDPATAQPMPANDLVCRVWADFREMPGLMLSVSQARRLWNLDESVCQGILDVLVDLQLLRRNARGLYLRRDGL
jgi:hypothetical protein